MKIRIYYEDTDTGGIVYRANYIKYCERARSEMFFDSEVKPFSKDGHFVVSEIRAKFKKPAVLGDLLEVKTSVTSLKKASALINQKIYKIANLSGECEPELVFEADVEVAFVSDLRPAKMSEEIVDFLSSYCS